ncbi:DUF3782 domain-containing protein [Synechocystis salina LEGE 06099]|uniref:DUF3782 domain-containing protein n=1 Tax=Synechocystis salina TaxID=945780 RepID=UPI0018829E8A|nr:DUF3782 domain-containing protein [Synechocystis salina]MBE9202521.1 DUF3782 domain-containing protein [Synechocystis salina LEGE 06099]
MATTLDEVLDLFKQAAQAQQEVAQAQQETERRFQATERILREQSQETERRIQEFTAENEKGFRILRKELGDLGGSWGRFVENMVAPACETLFQNRGIPVHRVSQRVRGRLGGDTLEIDVLVTNQDYVLAVEVKSRLSVQDVKDFIEDLQNFRQFFPEYDQKQLYGAVAGIDIENGADKYAYRQGLFILAQSGETVTILNGDQFQPKNW